MFGKKHKLESIEKIREKAIGRTWPKERRNLVSIKNKGKKYVGEEYENRYIKIKCPYCNKFIDKANYKRWHGDNCKNKIRK
jgi:hypothetical protein